MSETFFARHRALLDSAVNAIHTRGYWSPFPEIPSPKTYGETANDDGMKAYQARLQRPFPLALPGGKGDTGSEVSPFGPALGIRYPKVEIESLMSTVKRAHSTWRKATPEDWIGVSLESLLRINRRSFEMAYAVMHTTGQAFVMAFQAGGPHAQDRGLEAVAYAWDEISRVPKSAYWEKPQGKNPPLKMEKRFSIVPRGIGLVIGCCTFPTWNSYPGLFASLATGNAVVVKPHPGAILPLAITVDIIRGVISDAGFDPNVVTLAAHEAGDPMVQELARRPEITIIDFTGSPANGEWLEQNATQAVVYTEKAGVNQVVVDSTTDFPGLVRNLSFSLSLYSGQMCTAPQNIYVPKTGIETSEGHLSFDAVAAAIGEGIATLLGDSARAVEILGAIQNQGILDRLQAARSFGQIIHESTLLAHPVFPQARVCTPLLIKTDAGAEGTYMKEQFGPIAFVISTDDTEHSLKLVRRAARAHGALTLSVYSTRDAVLDAAREVAVEAGVSLSFNLTGGVYVNQSAAFSDFHGTGANPAANSSLTDAAFVASRFHVVQSRVHV